MYDVCNDDLPLDEAHVRRIQRAAGDLQRQVLAWADRVLAVLPQHLSLTMEDAELLRLYLAQQRRLNLELDTRNENQGFLAHLAPSLPLLNLQGRRAIARAAHRLASSYIEHAIEDTADRFCGRHGRSPTTAAALDWRVAIRYMAQQVHRLASSAKPTEDDHQASARRFELTMTARQLAAEVAAKRAQLLEAVETAASSS